MYGHIKLIDGTSSPDLAREIARYLTARCDEPVRLLPREIYKFANDNIYVKLGESVRGQDVYIIQSMGRPVNESIMEMLITLDAVRRDSAGRITAVFPYMAYTRSDKKDEPRVPITARLVADLIETAGADRYITLDLHSMQIQGFFKIPGDVMSTLPLLQNYVRKHLPLDNLTVTAVDLGFAKECRNWGRALGGVPVAFIEKKRNGSSVEAMSLVGQVRGRDVLLVDDEVDTGGSIAQAVSQLREHGARSIYLAFVHPVLSANALQRLSKAGLEQIICTNTLPLPGGLPDNWKVLSVAPLLGEVIYRAHLGLSVGAMSEDVYE
ncbi:MAG: ribose-phosphate diphosphokinase [Anaerolineae bacterium]